MTNLVNHLEKIVNHLIHENFYKRRKTSDRSDIEKKLGELNMSDMVRSYDVGEDPFLLIHQIVENVLKEQPDKINATLQHEAYQNARLKIAFECIGDQQLLNLFGSLIPRLEQLKPMTNVEFIHKEIPDSSKRKDYHYGQPDIIKPIDGIYFMIEMKVRGRHYYDAGQLCKYLNLADQKRRKEIYQNSSFVHLILKPKKRTNIFYKLGEKWIDQDGDQLIIDIENASKASKAKKWGKMLFDNREKYKEYLKFIPIYQNTYADIQEAFERQEYENISHYNSIIKQFLAIQKFAN